MGEDSVVECVYQNGEISAYASWTLPLTADEPSAEREGVVRINFFYISMQKSDS